MKATQDGTRFAGKEKQDLVGTRTFIETALLALDRELGALGDD